MIDKNVRGIRTQERKERKMDKNKKEIIERKRNKNEKEKGTKEG